MIHDKKLLEKFHALPEDKQSEVIDFIDFLDSKMKPFHLSFVVPDIQAARQFYVDILGCEIGRDTGKWIDILFFGHQLTLHQERQGMTARAIDHFGPILDKVEWLNVLHALKDNDISFEMDPLIKADGTEEESGKYIVKDPAGNILEFKYYLDFDMTVKAQK